MYLLEPPTRAFGGVMICKLDLHTFTSEFEPQLGPHSYVLVPYLRKNA